MKHGVPAHRSAKPLYAQSSIRGGASTILTVRHYFLECNAPLLQPTYTFQGNGRQMDLVKWIINIISVAAPFNPQRGEQRWEINSAWAQTSVSGSGKVESVLH